MQEKDVISIEYFSDFVRFADLINGYVFAGKEKVRPEDIREVNRSFSRIRKKSGKIQGQVLERDLVRRVCAGMQIVLIALENQSDIHYAMPVRVMNSDSMGYEKQWKEKSRQHREKGDLKGAGFLSGFGKDVRLHPIITIVVYFGEEEWDGPRSLKEMLDLSECPADLAEFISDYPIHLLDVRRYMNLEHFHTDLRYVFGFLQNTGKGDRLKEYVKSNEKIFADLEEDAYDLISVMSHSRELKMMKKTNKNEGGGFDMCRGIEELIEQGIERGMQQGRAEGILIARRVIYLDMSGSTRAEIADKCGISQEKVAEILEGMPLLDK